MKDDKFWTDLKGRMTNNRKLFIEVVSGAAVCFALICVLAGKLAVDKNKAAVNKAVMAANELQTKTSDKGTTKVTEQSTQVQSKASSENTTQVSSESESEKTTQADKTSCNRQQL